MPTYSVGPLLLNGKYAKGEYMVPLSTCESPLVACVNRGAKVSMLCGGVETLILKDEMTRAPMFIVNSLKQAGKVIDSVNTTENEIREIVESTTRYGKLTSLSTKLVGDNLFVRIGMQCGDAAGHNMTTKAAAAFSEYLVTKFNGLRLVSLSGNYCVDKKPNAVDSILGRGKTIVAQLKINENVCMEFLRSSIYSIHDLNIKKNFIGSAAAVSLGFNAHHANPLAALYISTGQDVGNIVEGSQGITTTSIENDKLVFSVTLPAIIVGTVGGGTANNEPKQNLESLGCFGSGNPIGTNSKKLADIVAASVLVAELNLLAVQTNAYELIRSHETIERKKDQFGFSALTKI